MDNPEKLTR